MKSNKQLLEELRQSDAASEDADFSEEASKADIAALLDRLEREKAHKTSNSDTYSTTNNIGTPLVTTETGTVKVDAATLAELNQRAALLDSGAMETLTEEESVADTKALLNRVARELGLED